MSDAPSPTAGPGARPEFAITHDAEPGGTLLVGFSQFGLAGLTAVDYLVDHMELTETGHVDVEGLPAITPFEDGTPRHHTRFFSRHDLDLTVLVGELFVPAFAAEPFGRAVTGWIETNDVEEVAVLSGVPVPHGPEEHDVFYVATTDYRERRLAGSDVPAMGKGFLDGVNAGLLHEGIDSPLAACVLVTPVHAQVPDVEAAIRLVETASELYDLDVDTEPLEAFAGEVQKYYEELSERLNAVEERQRPEDRMFM